VQGWAGAGGARLRTTRSVFCVFLFLYAKMNSVNMIVYWSNIDKIVCF